MADPISVVPKACSSSMCLSRASLLWRVQTQARPTCCIARIMKRSRWRLCQGSANVELHGQDKSPVSYSLKRSVVSCFLPSSAVAVVVLSIASIHVTFLPIPVAPADNIFDWHVPWCGVSISEACLYPSCVEVFENPNATYGITS